MSLEVEFRVGKKEDALCVSVLAMQVFLDTYAEGGIRSDLAREALTNYSPDAFTSRLVDPNTTFILAQKDRCLIGFCEVSRGRPCPTAENAGTVELVRLYVQPNSQRLGLGRALMEHAERLAVEADVDSLWLTAWKGNSPALEFYRAVGYLGVGSTMYTFEGKSYENEVLVKSDLGGAT